MLMFYNFDRQIEMAEDNGVGKPKLEPGKRRVSNYEGSKGWQERIYIPTLTAGTLGGGAGLLGGYIRGHGMAKLSSAYAINLAIVTSCFCGAQELVRELRAAEPGDPINSVLGGIASGGFLGRIQGGRPRVFQYAFMFALVGTGLQFGANKFQEYRSQPYLESTTTDALSEAEKPSEKKWWSWPEWAPIQKLDEEAAAKRAQERDLHIQRTIDKLKKGESS